MFGFVWWSMVAVQIAVQAGEETQIDLATAYREAADRSVAVLDALADVERARAELAVVRPLLPNPEIEGAVMSDVVTGNEGELDLDVGITQEIPFPFARLAAVDAAEARVRAAEERLAAARAGVGADVAEALIMLAVAADEARVRRDLAETAARLADATRKRFEQGAASAADANLADIELAGAASALARSEAAVAGARAALCALTGRAPCPALVTELPPLPALPVDDDGLQRALAARRDVVAAQTEVAAAERAIDAAQLARVPPVTLGLGAAHERGVVEDAAGTAVADNDTLLGVSLAIPLPLWNWGGGEVAQARAGKLAAEASLARARIGAQSDARIAVAELAAAKSARAGWQDAAPKIDETLGWYVQGYSTGATSLEDYLALRDRLVRARLESLDARREEALATVRVARALGVPVVQNADPGETR